MSVAYQVDYPYTKEVWYCKNYYWFKKRYNKALTNKSNWYRPIRFTNITNNKRVKYRFTYEYHTPQDIHTERKGEIVISGRTRAEAWQLFENWVLYDYDNILVNNQSVNVEEL